MTGVSKIFQRSTTGPTMLQNVMPSVLSLLKFCIPVASVRRSSQTSLTLHVILLPVKVLLLSQCIEPVPVAHPDKPMETDKDESMDINHQSRKYPCPRRIQVLGKCIYVLVQSKISIIKICGDTVQVLGKCIYILIPSKKEKTKKIGVYRRSLSVR